MLVGIVDILKYFKPVEKSVPKSLSSLLSLPDPDGLLSRKIPAIGKCESYGGD